MANTRANKKSSKVSKQKIALPGLSFSQEHGLEPLPGPLAPEHLSNAARNELWTVLLNHLDPAAAEGISGESLGFILDRQDLGEPWLTILFEFHRSPIMDRMPPNRIHRARGPLKEFVSARILTGPYNRVFDLLQFILQHDACPATLKDEIQVALDTCQTAYTVVAAGPRIMPRSSPQETAAFEKAYRDLSAAMFGGARSHLAAAADRLTAGDHAGCIRESVTAVESVAKVLSGQPSGALDPALLALEKKSPIHPAFKQGIQKLYAYSSDEKGVRHALLTEPARVDLVDAQFMLGSCASFVSYLIGKARASGLISE